MTIAAIETALRAHDFELMVIVGRRVLVVLRRRPPLRSFFGRGETLEEAFVKNTEGVAK